MSTAWLHGCHCQHLHLALSYFNRQREVPFLTPCGSNQEYPVTSLPASASNAEWATHSLYCISSFLLLLHSKVCLPSRGRDELMDVERRWLQASAWASWPVLHHPAYSKRLSIKTGVETIFRAFPHTFSTMSSSSSDLHMQVCVSSFCFMFAPPSHF